MNGGRELTLDTRLNPWYHPFCASSWMISREWYDLTDFHTTYRSVQAVFVPFIPLIFPISQRFAEGHNPLNQKRCGTGVREQIRRLWTDFCTAETGPTINPTQMYRKIADQAVLCVYTCSFLHKTIRTGGEFRAT